MLKTWVLKGLNGLLSSDLWYRNFTLIYWSEHLLPRSFLLKIKTRSDNGIEIGRFVTETCRGCLRVDHCGSKVGASGSSWMLVLHPFSLFLVFQSYHIFNGLICKRWIWRLSFGSGMGGSEWTFQVNSSPTGWVSEADILAKSVELKHSHECSSTKS